MINDLDKLLPPHKCSLTITHNQHRDYYESLDSYLQGECPPAWENQESHDLAIATDEIWEMQWYPDTPIGSHRIAAPTLEELLEFAKTIN